MSDDLHKMNYFSVKLITNKFKSDKNDMKKNPKWNLCHLTLD